jgi:hypothetical protein
MLIARDWGCKAKAINIIQREAHEDQSVTKIKGLADTHAEEESRMTLVEIDILADDGRHDPCAVPIDNAREKI